MESELEFLTVPPGLPYSIEPSGEEWLPPPPPAEAESSPNRLELGMGSHLMDDSNLLASILDDGGRVSGAVEVPEPVAVAVEAAASETVVKRKRGRPPKYKDGARVPVGKKKEEEEEVVCFICFDGGDLVVCDRRGCPKVYHPACVKRDESFFRLRGKWNCGWHICSSCEKAAQYMCYTCTYSLCKGCIKGAKFFGVRGSKGFCETCFSTIMLVESEEADKEKKVGIDFDDKSSWEYLFKLYWLDQKRRLSLTLEELSNARNSWRQSGASVFKEESSDESYDANNDQDASSDSSLGHHRRSSSSRKKVRKRSKNNIDGGSSGKKVERFVKEIESSRKKAESEGTCLTGNLDWASPELLEFVGHMKDGDISVISQFDVQALLLEYIKRNNLRDPRRKSQIICDSRLQYLFGKPRVGHFEMLKLLESHFLIKEASQTVSDDNQGRALDPDSGQMEAEGYSDMAMKVISDKRRKARKKMEKEPQINLDDYAAVDVHNINLIYLRRGLMEDLLDDIETFSGKVVGAFVRIRIPGTGQRQDMYRLVKVVGTNKVAESYKIGKKTTDVALEILNLDKKEVITVDAISNQEFTEEECKRLRQSVKCGLITRLTVGHLQEKARILQTLRVNDWLETEKLRLSHLRDRASETGRRKELRECVEKLQLLSTPEERMRKLNEVPEIHADPRMNPDYESAEEETDSRKSDSYKTSRSRESSSSRNGRDSILSGRVRNDAEKGSNMSFLSARGASTDGAVGKVDAFHDVGDKKELSWNQERDLHWTNGWDTPKSQTSVSSSEVGVTKPGQPYDVTIETTPSLSAMGSVPSNIGETDKVWHYKDPAGHIQGPFSIAQLGKWSSYFPCDLRIWLMFENPEKSVLLANVLPRFQKDSPKQEPQHNNFLQPTSLAGLSGNGSSNCEAVWPGNNYSTGVGTTRHGNNWNESSSNASFSSIGYTMQNAGRMARQSINYSAANGEVGGAHRVWEPSKDAYTWHSQVQSHKEPALTAQFSASSYGSSHAGGVRGGDFGKWSNGQDSENMWSPKSHRLHPVTQGHEKNYHNWSTSSQQSQCNSRENWKARPVSDSSSQLYNDSYSRPTITPQTGRDQTNCQGALSPHTASIGQPVGSRCGSGPNIASHGEHQSDTASMDSKLCPSSANSSGNWVSSSVSNVMKLSERSQGSGSWSSTSGSTCNMSKMEETVKAVQNPEGNNILNDFQTSNQQGEASEVDAQCILIDQPACQSPRDEMVSSNDATAVDRPVKNKNTFFEIECPSPTPQCSKNEPSVVQSKEPDCGETWTVADERSVHKDLVCDLTSTLASELSDPPASIACKANCAQLLSRDITKDLGDRDSISQIQVLNNQALFACSQDEMVDPASTAKLTAESDLLECFTGQRSKSLGQHELLEFQKCIPTSTGREEPDGSSINPVSSGGEASFSRQEPVKSSNWESEDDLMSCEWSLPSPTPTPKPSGWENHGISTSEFSLPGHVPPASGAEIELEQEDQHVSLVKTNATAAWEPPGQVSAKLSTGFEATPKINSFGNLDIESLSKVKTNPNVGWAASLQDTATSPGWQISAQGNLNLSSGWGTIDKENSNIASVWEATTTGNSNTSKNVGWAAPRNQGITSMNAGWGTPLGSTNSSWSSPAFDADYMSSQGKHNEDNYLNCRGSGNGNGRNWSNVGGVGGSSRPTLRGQVQKGICKFHESGYCKKGASCNYLHP
ncbi:uncharacterized protein [Typha angustifolia]|uniref:uncharacterized protein isoform X1 n=1 Tax=Typha angustifolia TaxID=59011 RepID=UPI003C2E3343